MSDAIGQWYLPLSNDPDILIERFERYCVSR